MAADETIDPSPAKSLSSEEISLRRYEARLAVWKVFWGSVAVAIASAAIPATVTLTTSFMENSRKEVELKVAKEQAHQSYIKEFLATGLNQDIELRLRFAQYFTMLAAEEQRALWKEYYALLNQTRERSRKEINQLEAQLAELEPEQKQKPVEYDLVQRKLKWLYAEVGYTQTDRSVISADLKDRLKKERLYKEAKEVAARLTGQDQPIKEDADDYKRFWVLYWKDLIGVESRDVASAMIALGNELKAAAERKEAPSPELKRRALELQGVIDRELRGT